MSKAAHFTYLSSDGTTKIHAVEWTGDGPVIGVLQIVHGMQEFIERYDHFARWMADQGFAVVGNDHLGHGASIQSEEKFGVFADDRPDRAVLSDMRALHRRTHEKYPDVPYFMLGHSMGSFLARQYLCLYGKDLTGAIISGTAYHPEAETVTGMILCRLQARRHGWMYRSPLLLKMSTGNFNKRFEPARTPADWLTRDEKVVDTYIADRRTQFTFTLNGYYGMFRTLHYLTQTENLKRMPKDLPMFFIAGEMDPVGNFGAGVKRVVVQLRSLGMTNIECHLYPNDRHEVLNELNRQEVYDDIWKWMTDCIARRKMTI